MKSNAPKTRIVYKVVNASPTFDPDTFFSWSPPVLTLGLKYRLGKVTKPKLKGSKIFVFKSFKNAEKLSRGTDPIFKCEATGVTKIIKLIPSPFSYIQTFKKFWKKGTCETLMTPPSGTCFCDSVKPIEIVR